MTLILNYKIKIVYSNNPDKFNYKYHITYNDKQTVVTQEELAGLINSTNSKDRNCKLVKNAISLKQGYGTLKVVYQKERTKKKKKSERGYVEIVDLENARKSYMKFIEFCVFKFEEQEFKEYKPYYELLKMEGIDVLNTIYVHTRFEIACSMDLSSGMKCLFVLAYLLDKDNNFIIDLSSCSSDYLDVAFKLIVKSKKNVKVVIRHTDVMSITTPIKWDGRIFSDGLEYFSALDDKRRGVR
jgi:hypothetical protein